MKFNTVIQHSGKSAIDFRFIFITESLCYDPLLPFSYILRRQGFYFPITKVWYYKQP